MNAAILLRRPLLVTGRPGVGKSGLAYRVARELRLGRVLQWPITSRSTLQSGLYDFDVIGRAQAGQAWYAAQAAATRAGVQPAADDAVPQDRLDIGEFIQLGPLGTAMLPRRLPRVLLIDEIDKSDADLPNDLLTLFEDGWFTVSPLLRVKSRTPEAVVHTADPGATASIRNGLVRTHTFPIVIMTSNGERSFPEAFMRRALKFDIPDPDPRGLGELVSAHFEERLGGMQTDLIAKFVRRRNEAHHHLSADQLLNAAHLATSGAYTHAEGDDEEWQAVLEAIWHPLRAGEAAGEGD
ncbi:AAA family ATPase [Streptomyces sp. T028]|uniref:AAA family ATPase n=1 Tax=Streptomyces sp. T028 TaxID=3394379 RepID=UPI003A88B565